MPEEKRNSDFEDLNFPFQEYLEDSESAEDFLGQGSRGCNIPKLLAGTLNERLAILKDAIM